MTIDTAAKRRPVGRGRGRFWQDYDIEAPERILVLAEAGAHDPLEAVALNRTRDFSATDREPEPGLWLVADSRQHGHEAVADANRISEDETELGRFGQTLAAGKPRHAM
ncbi:MAG: hypothetical protein WD382_07610 [Halofilum sp. (in: g-proteobacteria)]